MRAINAEAAAPDLPVGPKMGHAVDDTPFFIVGSGRCGSTLLRLMLCGHSRIHIPPETWFIRDLVKELPLTDPLFPAHVDRAVDIMTSDYRWPDMGIPAEEFRSWAHALDGPKLVEVINLVYHFQLKSHQKPRFGDKTPPYIHCMPEIAALYPGAKFIHLIRDGRDVAISFIEMENMRFYDRKFYWTLAMRERRGYLNSPYVSQILEVKYEDLVTRAEPTLRRLCEFLGEEFEPGMLDWNRLTELVPERERSIHSKLADPLRSEAVGVWQRKLSPFICFAMESCLQRDLRRLGYPVRFKSVAWRPLLILSESIFALVGPVMIKGIRYLQRRNYLPRTIYL